ncbi:hypothetical protein D9Q98_006836 [Chlorella vulgaris]|uniref:Uncharacterized protein n=1 Tax=Chlorella vulgaris TaxID=3077 RepID=A0A9D4TIX9_CHLVU|nr:hypothetical protein D9Q98_006836 [Chlorella vulgaris]
MSLLCTAARASQRIANQGISHHGIVPTLHASPLASHRRQQLPTRRHVCSATEDGADLDQQLQADLERVRQRQATAAPSPAAQQATSAAQRAANSKGDGPLAGVKDAVDKLLIADFFFILFALGWLGAGLAERSALQSTHLLDTWLSLWQWVFQPAIGVLMLGALVSGAVGWVKENRTGHRPCDWPPTRQRPSAAETHATIPHPQPTDPITMPSLAEEVSISQTHHLPAGSALSGSALSGSAGAPPAAAQILVSKVLTYSDVSTEVARTGRIVLPRIQVQQCLPELLQLCQAEGALAAVRSGGPVKLSVDLLVEDEAGRPWKLLMKTWQNVVSGEHRPTFVLENTADFVRANGLAQGDTLALCPHNGRMLLRTSLPASQLLPRQAKRGASSAAAGGPAAKRRAAAAQQVAAAAPAVTSRFSFDTATPKAARRAPTTSRRRRQATRAPPSSPMHGESAQFWQPQACHAEDAARVLLDIHDGGSSLTSSLSEKPAAAASPSFCGPTVSTAAVATQTPPPSARPVHRPHAVHGPAAVPRQQELLAGVAALDAAAAHQQQLLPLAPLMSSVQPQQDAAAEAAAAAASALPPHVVEQARRWLLAVIAEQEEQRRAEQQQRVLQLLQALKAQHEQQAAQQQQQQRQGCLAAAVTAQHDGASANWLRL